MIARILAALRRRVCRHEFRLDDLTLTGIPIPPRPPPGASRADCDRWGHEVICGEHPSHRERVAWQCAKCGREFRAHCGLEVLSHGTLRKIPA